MRNLLDRVKRAFAGRRAAWPWFDHLVRAGQRYKGDGGDRLAAALTMYAIFALLPLLLVAMSALGFVLAKDPDKQAAIFQKVTNALPGAGKQLGEALSTVKSTRATTGLIGLVGLLFSGLGGIDALRDALRLMWHQDTAAGNFFKKKATDALTVALLAVTLAVSFAVTALATGGAGRLLDGIGLTGTVSHALLYVLSFAVGVVVDAALFLVLFKWLPRVDWPWQRLVRGAVFGGFGFGLLKVVGAWYVGRTAARSTALYGSIGTAVALLVGLYLVSRVILFTAAWTVTAPGWDDVEPSGTASPEAAREAGIPVAEATGDGTAPRGVDGVPDFGRGDREPGREPGPESRPERGPRVPAGARSAVAARPEAAERVVFAARAIQGFTVALVAGAGLLGLRSLRRS
ncbi:MAG TPA: YihY/virulence factor BrkB family protein [Mycobacteriales bacterium]|jgi:membrane protein|nr:YihY/virulence factor BrkB family protein [Mycobacteriales bacterium]